MLPTAEALEGPTPFVELDVNVLDGWSRYVVEVIKKRRVIFIQEQATVI
jgi:hypothetical protein